MAWFDKELTYEEARELKVIFDGFFESKMWPVFQDLITERTTGREAELSTRCPNNTETLVDFAKLRGSIDELKLFPAMLGQIYDNLTEQIVEYNKKVEEENLGLNEQYSFSDF